MPPKNHRKYILSEEVIPRYRAGESVKTLAVKFGIPATTLARLLRESGISSGRNRYPEDAVCRVENCESPILAKWLCGLHYQRAKNTGTTDPPVKKETCKRGHLKTEENTYYYPDAKLGRITSSCKLCQREREIVREANVDNQIRRRDLRYRRLYNITYDEVESMAQEQDFKCFTCKEPCTFETKGRGAPGSFALDHCHSTGSIRGLLCHRCNKVLGLVQDDFELLYELADYLKRGSSL